MSKSVLLYIASDFIDTVSQLLHLCMTLTECFREFQSEIESLGIVLSCTIPILLFLALALGSYACDLGSIPAELKISSVEWLKPSGVNKQFHPRLVRQCSCLLFLFLHSSIQIFNDQPWWPCETNLVKVLLGVIVGYLSTTGGQYSLPTQKAILEGFSGFYSIIAPKINCIFCVEINLHSAKKGKLLPKT